MAFARCIFQSWGDAKYHIFGGNLYGRVEIEGSCSAIDGTQNYAFSYSNLHCKNECCDSNGDDDNGTTDKNTPPFNRNARMMYCSCCIVPTKVK